MQSYSQVIEEDLELIFIETLESPFVKNKPSRVEIFPLSYDKICDELIIRHLFQILLVAYLLLASFAAS